MTKKIAIPTLNGELCSHFGHCQHFTIVEVENGEIKGSFPLDPPAHEPGVYPKFLAEQGVGVIIAGGMGQRAQSLFLQNNIEVNVGVAAAEPEELVKQYLSDNLITGANLCDH